MSSTGTNDYFEGKNYEFLKEGKNDLELRFLN